MIRTQFLHCFRRDCLWRVGGILVAGFLSATSALGEVDGDWSFSYSDADYTASITRYGGTSATPSIPSRVSRRYNTGEMDEDGESIYRTHTYTVTALSNQCFAGNQNITSVSIPASVKTISGFAFCTNLESISFGTPPRVVAGPCFNGCVRLSGSIDLSECTHIGKDAFMECKNLEFGNLRLPNVTNIGAMAFAYCEGLTSIELSSNLKTLEGGAFASCPNLTYAMIDGTGLTLPAFPFSSCTNLQSVQIGNGVVSILPFEISPFAGCHSLHTIEIGTGITVVNSNVCRGLEGLKMVTFQGNIQSIEDSAFYNCSNLVSVSFGSAPKTIGSAAFYNCGSLTDCIELSQCKSIGDVAFYGCVGMTNVVFPNCLTHIGNSAFQDCSGLSCIELPSSLRSLGTSAFSNCGRLTIARIDGTDLILPPSVLRGCSNLVSVTLEDGVTAVSTNSATSSTWPSCFQGCTRLKSLEVGTGMESIDDLFCYALPSLETATFRGTIRQVGRSAFDSCTNLLSISLGGAPKTIGNQAFQGCRRLEGAIDLSQCTSIGSYAFAACSAWGFGDMQLPSITNIDVCAFKDCHGISSVVLPSSLVGLGVGAFQNCRGLWNAYIDGTDLSLSVNTFQSCTNLQRVVFGDGVTSVSSTGDYRPFGGCSSLRSIEIGTGVTIVSSYMCSGLGNLETVTFHGDIQSIGNEAFYNCTNLVSLSLGGAPRTIGYLAFINCRLLKGDIDLSQCTNVGNSAFYNCVSWPTGCVELKNAQSIGEQSFYGCTGISEVAFGKELASVGRFAFQNCGGLSNAWFTGGVPTVGSNPFRGVANGARGHYMAGHAAEWGPQIGADGKWQGLIMEEIPSPELRVESANPEAGCLMLAWEDSGAGEGVTYSVYRGAGESLSAALLVTNGLTGTSWTDADHAAAEPVLSPLNYWVVAEGGGYGERESNRVETRRRYALCVGINEYMEVQPPLQGCVNDSFYMEKNLVERGGWPSGNVTRLNDAEATKAAIRAAISNVAVQAVPGDTFVYQHSSHGDQRYRVRPDGETLNGEDGKAVFLRVYDGGYDDIAASYNDFELADDLGSFRAGVIVAVIVDACHSGGLFKEMEMARAAEKAVEDTFDIAERVSVIMDARRIRLKARGVNVAKNISSTEIGWATAVEYNELSVDGGFYHTDEWLNNAEYGEEYWDETKNNYNYPPSWKQGGVFTSSAMWGWWNGAADNDASAGDKDGYCDVYEFWKQGHDWSSRLYQLHAQCLNAGVLQRVELGVCKEGTGPVPMRTVTFDANGGSVAPDTKLVSSGESIGEMPVPEWAGHDFVGWFTAESGGSQILDTTEITTSQKVYAHWTLSAEYVAWMEEQGGWEALLVPEEDTDEDGLTNWAEYVSGTNPQDGAERLEARIRMTEDGRVVVEPSVDVPSGRLVKVLGKQSIMDDDWTILPVDADWDADGWRFFRVRVEMEE